VDSLDRDSLLFLFYCYFPRNVQSQGDCPYCDHFLSAFTIESAAVSSRSCICFIIGPEDRKLRPNTRGLSMHAAGGQQSGSNHPAMAGCSLGPQSPGKHSWPAALAETTRAAASGAVRVCAHVCIHTRVHTHTCVCVCVCARAQVGTNGLQRPSPASRRHAAPAGLPRRARRRGGSSPALTRCQHCCWGGGGCGFCWATPPPLLGRTALGFFGTPRGCLRPTMASPAPPPAFSTLFKPRARHSAPHSAAASPPYPGALLAALPPPAAQSTASGCAPHIEHQLRASAQRAARWVSESRAARCASESRVLSTEKSS
jgi:hypothetical protein